MAGWRDRWAAGTGPGPVSELPGTRDLVLGFRYQAPAGLVPRNFLHFEVVPGKPVPLLGLGLLIYEMSRLDQMTLRFVGPDVA